MASMYPIASSTAVLNQAFSDTGVILVVVIGTIVTATVALMGLGYGIRHLRKYISGRKF
jgi:hypothetical protein